MKKEYILINKTLFFPEKKILVIGDLHLGYDRMLKEQGIEIPFNQLEESKKEVKNIIKEIKNKDFELNKIILLGDVKHAFGFQKEEFFDVRDFLIFLEGFVKKENLIIIKGNHERFSLNNWDFKDFHLEGDIAFTHGDKSFPEIFNKKIKTIVMGHIHPAVILKDSQGIKKEKYKCFLIGEFNEKQIIVVPSFFPLIPGTEMINEYADKSDWAFIPKKNLLNFETYVIGKNKVYEFGKLKNIGEISSEVY
jgi:uncharacterized protein